MKKLLFSMALVLTSLSAFAQTYKNEVKLNILNVIAVPMSITWMTTSQ